MERVDPFLTESAACRLGKRSTILQYTGSGKIGWRRAASASESGIYFTAMKKMKNYLDEFKNWDNYPI